MQCLVTEMILLYMIASIYIGTHILDNDIYIVQCIETTTTKLTKMGKHRTLVREMFLACKHSTSNMTSVTDLKLKYMLLNVMIIIQNVIKHKCTKIKIIMQGT